MQIFNVNEQLLSIYRRAMALNISKEFAHQQNGQAALNPQQSSEQENRRRELLAVELKANQQKIIAEHGEAHFRQQISNQLQAKVMLAFNNDLDNKENLYNNVLHFEQAAPDILELLAVKAASIKRITPLVKSLTWLADDVVTLVNKPQYRKRADVQVHNANLAVSYIGLENLKLVMPTFMLKRWLPISTSPFPLMKRKLWYEALSVALASKILAAEQGLNEYFAFAAGMLSSVGALAVTRCFLAQFNEIHGQELREAYENKDKRLHDILVEIKAPAELLLQQLTTRSYQISANLVEQMNFDRLALVEAMFDLGYTEQAEQMHPLAKVIARAKAYVDFRNLAREDLISNDEAKVLFTAVQLTPSEIMLLKKSDIDHLKLNFK